MCTAAIADPLGVFRNPVTAKLADPLGVTDHTWGDPGDVLGKRAGAQAQQQRVLNQQQADAEAAANVPRQAAKTPVAGIDGAAGGGSSGYSTLLTGLSGVDPSTLTTGRTALGGAQTLLGA